MMAGLYLTANSGTQGVLAGTAETILQLVAPANQRLKIIGFSLTVAGTSAVDMTVRVLRQTSAGTSGTSVTPSKKEPAAAETIQSTAATNFSAEPTASSVLEYKRLQGAFEKIYPFGQELIVAGAGRIGIECTAVAAASVAAEFTYEE